MLRLVSAAFALIAGSWLPASMTEGQAAAAARTPIVMGTDLAETTFTGIWARRIYVEAFRRLDIPLEFAIYPLKRLSLLADEGAVDGESLRVHGYADAHPNLIRVEESVFDAAIVLYTANRTLNLSRIEDLPSRNWLAEYRRGVGVCEQTLKQALPAAQISDVATTEQALRKLLAGRTDIYCDLDLAVLAELYAPEFKAATPLRKLIEVSPPIPLYPYLHRKNAALAPRLAATLRQMKTEGLIQRYRIEAENDAGAAR